MNRTEKGLLARGVDTACAAKLAQEKWTIEKLKLENRETLAALWLSSDCINSLFDEGRPPIPSDTLTDLLFANRFQCCVCRDPSKPFIVHHIEEWAVSRSHDAINLVTLCLEHHAKAHTVGTLERNLDKITLQQCKAKWESEVKRLDSQAIIAASRLQQTHWNYINELRVLEMARSLNLKIAKISGFDQALKADLIDTAGVPTPVRTDTYYMYEGYYILQRYFYMSSLLDAVLERTTMLNLSDHMDKGVLVPILTPGDIIFVQGRHVFSPITQTTKGRGQDCRVERKANGVVFRFVFDRWEATSSSAKNC